MVTRPVAQRVAVGWTFELAKVVGNILAQQLICNFTWRLKYRRSISSREGLQSIKITSTPQMLNRHLTPVFSDRLKFDMVSGAVIQW